MGPAGPCSPTVARSWSALGLALALLASLALTAVAAQTSAQTDDADVWRPESEDWTLQPRIEPGEGFTVTAEGTVEGEPARLERSFDLDERQLTTTYTQGDREDPSRHLETQLRLTGVYVFEDDGDGRLDLADRIVEHRRLAPDGDAYVTPVRSSSPLSAARAVLPLEDRGQIALTLTSTSDLAVVRGDQMTPTDARLNLTVAGVSANEDRHVALAAEASADAVTETDEGLTRLDGTGASLVLDWQGPMRADQRDAGATVLEDETDEGPRALIFLASPAGPTSSHDVETSLVHTSSGLQEVSDAVQGQPLAFVVGLLAASGLVGAAAWRKLN